MFEMRSKVVVVEFVSHVKIYVDADVGEVSRCVQLSARSFGSPNCPFNSPQLLLGTVARTIPRGIRWKTTNTPLTLETVVLIFSHRYREHYKEKTATSFYAIFSLSRGRVSFAKKKILARDKIYHLEKWSYSSILWKADCTTCFISFLLCTYI